MKIKNFLLAISITTIGLYGCATPHVVQTKKIGDKRLTCSKIEAQIEEANEFEKKARAERKVTGTNVAAAILFWPALLGTYSNTEEAIEAARERKQNLAKLYEKKKCQ